MAHKDGTVLSLDIIALNKVNVNANAEKYKWYYPAISERPRGTAIFSREWAHTTPSCHHCHINSIFRIIVNPLINWRRLRACALHVVLTTRKVRTGASVGRLFVDMFNQMLNVLVVCFFCHDPMTETNVLSFINIKPTAHLDPNNQYQQIEISLL